MRTSAALWVLLALAAAGTAPAEARVLGSDNTAAATLLLPYFEVDLADPTNGVTTIFSINNASATAALARVTLWTDLAVPTMGFNVYLTGYDVQAIDLRDVFNGNLPQTASDGQDPTDTISNQGPLSQDINFASCTGILPPTFNAPGGIRALHTGGPIDPVTNSCAGRNLGDNIARGFVTIDAVNACSPSFGSLPDQPGYFGSGGTGVATNQNILWGQYSYVNSAQNFAMGDALVAIETSPGVGLLGTDFANPSPETSVSGQYTFYGRLTSWNAADNREPLPSIVATRFATGGAFGGGTRLLVWRDPKIAQQPFTCGTTPYTLSQEQVAVFDEQENAVVLVADPFPAAANSVQVGGSALPVPFSFGWLFLNLNAGGGQNPPEDPLAAQAWVTTVMSGAGRFSVGQTAIALSNAGRSAHLCVSPGCRPAPIRRRLPRLPRQTR